jgi:hypothetical protein
LSAIAVAESLVNVPLAVAFGHFIDFSYWNMWMPASLRPLSGPARALHEGDRMTVALGGRLSIPTELRVVRVRPDKEICWRAGVSGALSAEHSYFFTNVDGKTRIRSEELFSGALALGPLAKLLERLATQHAEQALAGFARYVTAAPSACIPPDGRAP